MEPTEEQKQRFWERCADDWLPFNEDKHRHYRFGDVWTEDEPPIDLNNLFKYAVPKVFELGLFGSLVFDARFNRATILSEIGVKPKLEYVGENKDPALALFWATYKALGGKDG